MNNEANILWLSQEDVIAAGAMDMELVLGMVEKINVQITYNDGGIVEGVSRVYFDTPIIKGHRIASHTVLMRTNDMNIFSIKGIPSNPENPVMFGLPRSNALVTLYDVNTVMPFAVMDGKIVSDMRTGAGGALGAKYLANPDSEILGLVGLGPIAGAHINATSHVMKNLKIVRLYDWVEEKAHRFAEKWSHLGYKFEVVKTCEEAVADSDIVFTCTNVTNGEEYIPAEWIKRGSFHAPSSIWDYKPETVSSAFDRYAINFEERLEDSDFPLYHHLKNGTLKREQIQVVGKIIRGLEKCRVNHADCVYLSTLGINATDLAINYAIYKRAIELGLGTKVSLWKKAAYF